MRKPLAVTSRRRFLGRRRFLQGGAALGALATLHPFSLRAASGQAHLRLMETTDLHVHVHPYDYYADRPNDTMGLARTASLIEAIRAEARNTLLLDNGDYLQGNPMGDFIAYERGLGEGDVHPVIKAMNVLAYDCGTLGNHEFNYGIGFMDKVNAGAAFPIVCANAGAAPLASTPRGDALHLPPYVLLDRQLVDGAGAAQPIRIGVIGFVPPQIMRWDRHHLEGRFAARDMMEAARAWVPEMREAGADIVIALAHAGISAEPHRQGMENAALHLAAVEGIDVVLAGHQHLVFPGESHAGLAGVDAEKGTLFGKPAVMAGFWGSHLGLVDLLLEREGASWRVLAFACEARPIFERAERETVALVESRAEVLASVAEEHAATLAYVRTPVGESAAHLHSYFALVADDPSVQVVNQAQLWYIGRMLAGTEWAGLPILSAAAPFKAGGRGGPDYYTDVPPGPLAIKNVADLYLYPNTIQAVLIDGATVKEWLERSAGIFNRIEPGAVDAELLNPAFPSYNFDVIDGVSYAIDLSQPARYAVDGTLAHPEASRITDLRYAGEPIDPAQLFVVATNNYRAGGGGGFPGADGSTVIFIGPDTNRDVIVRHIVEEGVIDPAADGNWRFAPMPGSTAVFATGPGAVAHAENVRGVTLAPAGEAGDGFVRYRLML